MLSDRFYSIAKWHSERLKRTVEPNVDKIYDVVIACAIDKLINNEEYWLYDVTISGLKVVRDQCMRGNSPENNSI